MARVWFTNGDYEYSNVIEFGTLEGGTDVAVRVNGSIRSSAESLSDIPSYVTYEGVTYRVRYLQGRFPTNSDGDWARSELAGAFSYCTELKQLPNLPETIDYVTYPIAFYLFAYCSALLSVPSLPSGPTTLRNTYSACATRTSPQTFPTPPNTVTVMDATYSHCSSMIVAPSLPSSLENMVQAFSFCGFLTTAPTIPESVKVMTRAFEYCVKLEGNIVVRNTPTAYAGLFAGTARNIYIISDGNAGSVWKDTIVPAYSNVHYEADDHPNPNLMGLQLTRVASSGSTTPAEQGLWAYLSAKVEISTAYLPTGWTGRLGTISLKLDGTAVTPTWTVSGGPTGTITLTAWVNVGDTNTHTFEMFAEENVSSGSTVKKVLSTPIITQTLPKAFALIDYYHDDAVNLEGVAIGKYAEQANLFDIAMPTRHNNKVTFRDDITLEGDGLLDLGEVAYGTCSTAAGTTTKVVTTSLGTFSLTSGQYVIVKFDNATSVNTSVNVDSTGSKQARYNGARISSSNGNWSAGDLVIFEYDGTYYQRIMPDDSSLPVDVKLAYNTLALGWTDCFEQEVHI